MIDTTSFPKITPVYIDPLTVTDPPGLLAAQASKLMIKTLLIDPYTPFHLYTGILPIKSLQLPAWSLEAAMKNMSKPTFNPQMHSEHVANNFGSCILHFRASFGDHRRP